jgi:hypothetical protein
LAGGRCCAGSCHSGQTVGAVGAAPPPTTTAARGATPSKGQAPGLLVARLRRTLLLAPGALGSGHATPEADMAPGAARGGGAYRCPTCGVKCRGSGPRRRPRPPARFWSCSKRVPALP